MHSRPHWAIRSPPGYSLTPPRHSRVRGNLSFIRPTNVVESATVPPHWAIRSPPPPRHSLTPTVIPAFAGIRSRSATNSTSRAPPVIPAFAGISKSECNQLPLNSPPSFHRKPESTVPYQNAPPSLPLPRHSAPPPVILSRSEESKNSIPQPSAI